MDCTDPALTSSGPTTVPSASNSDPLSPKSASLSSGAKAGIVVGVVVGALLIVAGGIFYLRRRRSKLHKPAVPPFDDVMPEMMGAEKDNAAEVYGGRPPAETDGKPVWARPQEMDTDSVRDVKALPAVQELPGTQVEPQELAGSEVERRRPENDKGRSGKIEEERRRGL